MSDINELRAALFETLHAVKSGSMDIDRAKTVSEVAQTIINTAKLEVDYVKATGAEVSSQFLECDRPRLVGMPPAQPSIASQLHAASK